MQDILNPPGGRMQRNLHVVPDPDSPGWLVLEMSDQEAFDWDHAHYGKVVAIENLLEIREPTYLGLTPGPEG